MLRFSIWNEKLKVDLCTCLVCFIQWSVYSPCLFRTCVSPLPATLSAWPVFALIYIHPMHLLVLNMLLPYVWCATLFCQCLLHCINIVFFISAHHAASISHSVSLLSICACYTASILHSVPFSVYDSVPLLCIQSLLHSATSVHTGDHCQRGSRVCHAARHPGQRIWSPATATWTFRWICTVTFTWVADLLNL